VQVATDAAGTRTTGPARTTAQHTAALLASMALLLSHPGAHAVVSPGERQGLVNLYIATNGTGWTGITRGWHNHANAGVDPCDPSSTVWTGVTCRGTTSITYVGFGRDACPA
jgi:hypothetical protein